MTTAPHRPRKRAPRPAVPPDLALAVKSALDKKAHDLTVLDLRKASAFTDYFLICTGTSSRQVKTIADAIQTALAKGGIKPALVEGLGQADWVLIDYFDFVVHVFTPTTREFYALERLWGDAERIEVSA